VEAPLPHSVPDDCRTTAGLGPVHVTELARQNGWRPERFGESVLGIPLVAWWPTTNRPTRVVWAAIHGEEAVTMQAAHQLLRQVHAEDSCAVVVPVLNPDGVLAATRQNARGVDLNRNFPCAAWRPDPSPTFWPTTTVRTSAHRTQLSSPGSEAGSEPEVQAIIELVQRVEPIAVIDLHTPLECVIAFEQRALHWAEHLAEPAGIPVLRELASPTPGDSATWCASVGVVAVTYEFELAPIPQLWQRHAPAMARCIVDGLGDRSA
jgi:predicted deacylase